MLLVVACGGNPPRQLADVEPEPPGLHCAYGGQAIATGTDDNGDGMLEDGEIDSTEYVCDGAGKIALVTMRPEPAGANCADGGTAVLTGLDGNGDGVLEADEVAQTIYVCNGPGVTELAVTHTEPPGPNCEFGGVAIQSGPDLDGDFTLDPSEITATSYACNATVPSADVVLGDFQIHTQLDVALLAHTKHLTGNLTIAPAAMDLIGLPALEHVGSLAVHAGSAPRVVLPSLTTVDGVLVVDAPQLTSFEVPAVTGLGSLSVSHANALPALAFPALAHVGAMDVMSDPMLATFDVPALATSGRFHLESLPVLAAVHAPALTNVAGDFTVIGDAGLASIDAPALAAVTGTVTIDNLPAMDQIDLSSLASYTSLSLSRTSIVETKFAMPKPVAVPGTISLWALPWTDVGWLDSLATVDSLFVQHLDGATALVLPALTTARTVTVTFMPALDMVAMPQLTQAQELQLASVPLATAPTFPALAHIGKLSILQTGLTAPPSFPVLTDASFIEINDNAQLTSIAGFDALASTQTLWIDNDDAVASVSFPRLTSAPQLVLRRCDQLTSIQMDRLDNASLDLSYDFRLASVAFSSLHTAGSIDLFDDSALSDLQGFAAVTSIGTLFLEDSGVQAVDLANLSSLGRLESSGTALERIVLPTLVSLGSLQLSNDSLDHVELPSVTSVTGPIIVIAPNLPTCQITDVLARVGYTGTQNIQGAPCVR